MAMSDVRRLTDALGTYEGSYPPELYLGPTVATLAPSSIVIATPTPVTITGTNFALTATVYVDGVGQPTDWISATQVRYLAEASAVGTQDVAVRSGGKMSAVLTLTVTATHHAEEPQAQAEEAPPQ
jgi:hypothetical protein